MDMGTTHHERVRFFCLSPSLAFHAGERHLQNTSADLLAHLPLYQIIPSICRFTKDLLSMSNATHPLDPIG
jgi:hypothetical protein